MFTSGDSLLIKLTAVILPAFIVLIGTIIYSYVVINRYSKTLSRLYRSSFTGVDTERKRIASELHDHFALHAITVAEQFESLKTKIHGNELAELNTIQTNFQIFQHRTHQIIEYMYPKGLLESDWEGSLNLLSQQMSIGNIRVTFESFAQNVPQYDWLYHTYWAIQEIVTNAIRHSGVNRIQISASDEDGFFAICIHYRATTQAKQWIQSKSKSTSGLGSLIVRDRLNIVGAKMSVEIQDGVVTHTITLKNENPHI